MTDKNQQYIRFSDLSKAEKQEDSKELEKLKVKANAMICKAKGTIASLLKAVGKLDEVWKSSKKTHATRTVVLKLINYSCSSYPTRASYSGQVDGFRNPMKNELKRNDFKHGCKFS